MLRAMPQEEHFVSVPLSRVDLAGRQFQIRVEPRPGELHRSLERDGQLVPVLLQERDPLHRIIDGHRRCHELARLGVGTVRALLRRCSDEEALRLAFVANSARKTLAPADRWNAIRKLRALDLTHARIAAALSLHPDSVRRLAALFPATKDVGEGIDQGWLRPSHLRALRDLLAREDWPRWLRVIREERLAAAELYRRIGADERLRETKFVSRETGGVCIFTGFRFDPKTALSDDVWRAITQYEKGLTLLRAWVRKR